MSVGINRSVSTVKDSIILQLIVKSLKEVRREEEDSEEIQEREEKDVDVDKVR